MPRPLTIFMVIIALFSGTPAHSWHDATHMAVVKAAGLDDYIYLAVGADMAKDKSGGHEDGNHYRNNARGAIVTADMVLDQVRDYNCRCSGEGHLYGAIIAAIDQYRERAGRGKYGRYPLGFAMHYIGDLSMPLHNVEFNDFNKAWHAANDGVVEGGGSEATGARVARIAARIRIKMASLPPVRLPPVKADIAKFNRALAHRIAEIANRAIALGYAMQDSHPQRPIMTEDEAYRQLAESAALLKAVYAALQ
jgi:hypothetical protein